MEAMKLWLHLPKIKCMVRCISKETWGSSFFYCLLH